MLNERLKKARIKSDLTLLKVAEKLNVSEATVQRYESGNIKNIKYETILSLAKLYDVSPNYLMGWEDEEPAETEINPLMTIAAHHDSYDFSEDELKEIESYINYVKSKKAREDDK